MVTTEKLFDLIAGLAPTEIQYFNKLYGRSTKRDTQGLKLFQVLLKSIVRDKHGVLVPLDEVRLKIQMARQGVVATQFHVVRYNLSKMVLRALRLMQEESSRADEVRIKLKNAQLLAHRGFFDWAEDTLQEALDTAREFQFHALEIEARIALLQLRAQGNHTGYVQMIREQTDAIEASTTEYTREKTLFTLQYQAVGLYRTDNGMPRATELKNLWNQLEQTNPGPNSTFLAQLYHRLAHAALAELEGGGAKAQPWFASLVELWEEKRYRDMRHEYPQLFIAHFSNFLGNCLSLGDFITYDAHINQLLAFKAPNLDVEAELFQDKMYLYQLYYLNKGQFGEAMRLVPEIEAGLIKYNFKINTSRRFVMRYHIVLTYFALEKYKEAVWQCEVLLHAGKTDQRQDVQSINKILRQISYLELKELEELKRFVQSVKKNLGVPLPRPDFERIVLQHLVELSELCLNHPTEARLWQKILRPVMEKFKTSLEDFKSSQPPKIPLGYQETLAWINSKINNIPFRDLL